MTAENVLGKDDRPRFFAVGNSAELGLPVAEPRYGSGAAQPGQADPVETHVYLDTPEGAEFARTIVDMIEQSCFLHALCRTDLRTRLIVGSSSLLGQLDVVELGEPGTADEHW